MLKINKTILTLGIFLANVGYADNANKYMNEDGVSTDARHNGYPICENCTYEDNNGYQYKKCNNCRTKGNGVLSGTTKKVEGLCKHGYEYKVGLFGGNFPKFKCCRKGKCEWASDHENHIKSTGIQINDLNEDNTGYGSEFLNQIKSKIVIGGTSCDLCVFNKNKGSTCAKGFWCIHAGDAKENGWSQSIGHCTPEGKKDFCSITKNDVKKYSDYSDREINLIKPNGTDCEPCVFNLKSTPNIKAGSTCSNGYYCVNAGNAKDNGWSERVGICRAAGKPVYGVFQENLKGMRADVCSCIAFDKGFSALNNRSKCINSTAMDADQGEYAPLAAVGTLVFGIGALVAFGVQGDMDKIFFEHINDEIRRHFGYS